LISPDILDVEDDESAAVLTTGAEPINWPVTTTPVINNDANRFPNP